VYAGGGYLSFVLKRCVGVTLRREGRAGKGGAFH